MIEACSRPTPPPVPVQNTSGHIIGPSLALATLFALMLVVQWIYYKKKGRLPCDCKRAGDNRSGSPPPSYSLTKILSSQETG